LAENSFLAEKIEVGVAAGTRMDDGGKVPRKIVGVSGGISQRERKGKFQCNLGCSDELAVVPGLTINRDIIAGRNCTHEWPSLFG